MLENIINELIAGRKQFIFYPYINAKQSKNPDDRLPSMEEFKLNVEKLTGRKGVCYNSKSDDDVLKGLNNVFETWHNVDFVITNTKITVGINYELDDFDAVNIMINGYNFARDIIQVSYRCRSLKSNNIYVCYLDGSTKHTAFEKDEALVGNCPIYKSLINDIIIEKSAPLKQSIQFMFYKAHYKYNIHNKNLDIQLQDHIKKLFLDSDTCFSFNDILECSYFEIKEIEQKIYGQNATLDDKMRLDKYYFTNKFIDDAPIESLSDAWDKRYNFFF
jgi:hypothetical protein